MFEKGSGYAAERHIQLANFCRPSTYVIFNTFLMNLNVLVIIGFIINAFIHLPGKCERKFLKKQK